MKLIIEVSQNVHIDYSKIDNTSPGQKPTKLMKNIYFLTLLYYYTLYYIITQAKTYQLQFKKSYIEQ